MATLTIRMTDQKANKLKVLASHQDISVNRLIEELATQAITEYESEMRFRMRAARGSAARGKTLLAELDNFYGDGGQPPSPPGYQNYGFHDHPQSSYDAQMPVADPQPPKKKK